MAKLIKHGKLTNNLFALNGLDENSATYALGWVLANSDKFLKVLVNDLSESNIEPDKSVIELQKHSNDSGITDIEIIFGNTLHIIIEAKQYWQIPEQDQLLKYTSRFNNTCAKNILISLSAATQEFANSRLPTISNDILLLHRSWHDIQLLVTKVFNKTRIIEERLWLKELNNHLMGYVSMQDPKDNSVYVVSLSAKEIIEGSGYSWIDVVEKDSTYFHPVGTKGWPSIPPNYLGIRYLGQLQGVYHVDSYKLCVNLKNENRLWPKTEIEHFIYNLGPVMKPNIIIKNGKIYPNGRYWCAIDTLLSGQYKTISEARDETNKRFGNTL